MKLRSLTLALGTLAVSSAYAAPLVAGNIVLNLTSPGATGTSPIRFEEYNPTSFAAPLQTITVASTGTDAITQLAGTGTEGGISGVHGGNSLFFAGYGVAAGGSIAGAPRRVGQLNYATGAVTFTDLASTIYTGNFRTASGVNNGAPGRDFVLAGTGGTAGTRTGTVGSADTTSVGGTFTNIRVAHSGPTGIVFSSAPGNNGGIFQAQTDQSVAPTTLFQETGSSLYDFQFYGTDVIYVADDRTTGAGGISKLVRDSSGVYTRAYNIQLPGATAGSFLGTRQFTSTAPDANGNATFYAVGSNGANLFSFTDNTLATSLTTSAVSTSIFTAPTGSTLRGVEVVPEPATMAAMALGLGALAARRRRRKSN